MTKRKRSSSRQVGSLDFSPMKWDHMGTLIRFLAVKDKTFASTPGKVLR